MPGYEPMAYGSESEFCYPLNHISAQQNVANNLKAQSVCSPQSSLVYKSGGQTTS